MSSETSTNACTFFSLFGVRVPVFDLCVCHQDAEDRSIAVAIHQAIVSSVRLELLPKSTIDIFLTIIETDGIEGCVASGSVAASTALADAGIEMLGLVMSCAAVCLSRNMFSYYPSLSCKCVVGKEVWLDPTEEEARASNGSLVLACMPALGTITSVWQSGQMKAQEVLQASAFIFFELDAIYNYFQ